MRCNNCGWDNPDMNTICEKCTAPLDDTVMESKVASYNYAGAIAVDNPPPYEFDAGIVEEKKSSFGFSMGKFTPQSTAVGIAPDDFFPQSAADTPTDDFLFPSVAVTELSDEDYSLSPVDGYLSETPATAATYDDMLEVVTPETISYDSVPAEPPMPVFQANTPSEPPMPVFRDSAPAEPPMPVFQNSTPAEPPMPVFRDSTPSEPPMPVFQNSAPAEPTPKPDIQKDKPQEPAIRAIINIGVAAPKVALHQCPECGYPARPGEPECAMCGAGMSEVKEEQVNNPSSPESFKSGTFIQVTGVPHKDKISKERRKLIGFLVTYSNSPNGDFFPVYEGKNYIGRASSCHANIQGDSSISEKHMSILYRAVDCKIKFKDEQSSNGTYVNGELLDEGELKNFDKIRVGATQLLFMEIPFSMFE